MSKKKTICIKCRHHIFVHMEHVCYAKSTTKTDYVVGIREAEGVLCCYNINKNGDCPDYEKKTKKNDYPKPIFGGIVDYIRQKREEVKP